VTLDHFLAIVFIQTTLSAIVFLVCMYHYRKREKYIKLIGFIFLVGFLANVAAFIFRNVGLQKIINTPQTFYMITNITLVTIIYFKLFRRKPLDWLWIAVPFFLLAVANTAFIQKDKINTITLVIQSFIILIYTLVYFYRLMVELPAQHIHHVPMFWFNSAFLIFHAGTFFLFVFTDYIVHVMKNNMITYWSFHNALSIIEHSIVLVGLYYDFKSRDNMHVG